MVLVELQAEEYVNLFAGVHGGLIPTDRMIQRCWDLPALEADYKAYVARYQPEYEASQVELQNGLSPEICFARRFWMTEVSLRPRQERWK